MATDVRGLVDSEQGFVSRRIFIEDEIYRQELERIFARVGSSSVMKARYPIPATSSLPTWARTPSSSAATQTARSAHS